MLISPPFLLTRLATETEDAWIDRCMAGGQPGDGAFPLSFNLGWHGGMHLIAPMNGNQPEPVRAIADGTVVVLRKPTPQPAGPLPAGHPLTYRGRWTDDGLVVLRHETEIGEGINGQVVFFSIHMHLSAIHPALALGRTVYRKAEIGTAGQLYGNPQRGIHFEIVCNDANLRALVGRSSGDLRIDADGRLDAVYGQMYFVLPGGTAFYGRKPLDHLSVAHVHPPKPNATAPLPPLEVLEATYTSGTDDLLVIGLRYAGGEGEERQRGSAYLTTLRLDGTTLGDALEEVDAEYNLYARANEVSEAHPADARPAPSAVYELLRFGRVVNTANETQLPQDVPHWREVRYPGGQGWVNLNAANVRKFSDADFPHWQRWQLIDDSEDCDSRCDSPTLRSWLDVNGDGQLDLTEATSRLSDPSLAPRLARTICKFPSEWELGIIDQRWSWLKTSTPENPLPLPDEKFQLFCAHIQALAFLPGNTGLPSAHWHFQPKEFVKQFRKCGWIESRRLASIYPQASAQNVVKYSAELSKCIRKYLIQGCARVGHFLGQAAVESSQFIFMSELYNGDPFDYFRPYAKAKNFSGWLGNVEWNDGGTFRGRGFKQLTGRDNYARYWCYRGWLAPNSFKTGWWRNTRWWGLSGTSVPASAYGTLPIQDAATIQQLIESMRPPAIANADLVSTDLHACIDTAGWFWAKNGLLKTADDNDAAEMTRKIRGDAAAVGVSQPWPQDAHFPQRQAQTERIIGLLGDLP
jgi:predicted chitinase